MPYTRYCAYHLARRVFPARFWMIIKRIWENERVSDHRLNKNIVRRPTTALLGLYGYTSTDINANTHACGLYDHALPGSASLLRAGQANRCEHVPTVSQHKLCPHTTAASRHVSSAALSYTRHTLRGRARARPLHAQTMKRRKRGRKRAKEGSFVVRWSRASPG